MRTDLFYWVLNMSIAGGITGLCVLLIGRIRLLPRRLTAALWVLPFLRFFVPVGIGGKYGLFPLLRPFVRVVKLPAEGSLLSSVTAMNAMQTAIDYAPVRYADERIERVYRVGMAVWGIGALALLLTFSLLYLITLRELRDAVRDGDAYYSDKVTSPAVYGVLKPRILLPLSRRGMDNGFILLHEQTHRRRQDNLRRILAFFCASVHWFNPLAWVFLHRFLTETELACDEAVLANCEEGQRSAYASSLLDAAEERQKTLFASAFGGAPIRLRLGRILSYRKMTWTAAIGCGLFLLSLACVLLTNPM